MCKVSVLLPSLNVVDYIDQCISSVICQTLTDIEILCIDAGSTDGTLEVIKQHAASDHRIKIIQAKKKSYGYQMNIGISEAKGEYIGIVETDDYVDSDMFEILYEKAKMTKADMVKSVLYEEYEFEQGKSIKYLVDYIPDYVHESIPFSPDDHPDIHDLDGNIWNGIYLKRFLLDNNILFNESPGAAFQDIGFQQMVLNEATCVVYTHCHFYHYRKVRQGASTWNPKCVRFIYQEYKKLLVDAKIKNSHKRSIFKRMIPAFLHEYHKALCFSDYNLQDIDCPEAIDWFENIVRSAINENYFEIQDLNENNRIDLLYFLAGRDYYIQQFRERTERVYEWFYKLKDKIKDKDVVIFGAGSYGLMLVEFLIKNGVYVSAMADNNKWLCNKSYCSLKVLSAADAVRFYKDAFYLVASKNHAEAICRQLQQMRISEDKIIIFDGADNKLVEGIKRRPILVKKSHC